MFFRAGVEPREPRLQLEVSFSEHCERIGEDLGGGFKYFLFSSLFGEDSHFDEYFSKGLVQPPTRDGIFLHVSLPTLVRLVLLQLQ